MISCMKRTDPQFKLRIPQDLKERLEHAADIEGRSVTAEIVHRLEASFPAISAELLRSREVEAARFRAAARRLEDEAQYLQARITSKDFAPLTEEALTNNLSRVRAEQELMLELRRRALDDIQTLITAMGGKSSSTDGEEAPVKPKKKR